MAFTPLSFTKDWTNPLDFPTYEDNETKVRSDMQFLYNEIRDYINNLLTELIAKNLPFEPTPSVDASTIQNAIEVVSSQVTSSILGQIPDGSITSEKLAAGAVTEAKLGKGAVTSGSLADGAVTAAALAAGAVGSEALAEKAVTTDSLANGSVTAEKLDGDLFSGKADLNDARKVVPEQVSRDVVVGGGTRDLTLADAGKVVYMTNTGAATITIPSNSAVAFPIDTEIEIYRAGGGDVTIAAASNVTILAPTTNRTLSKQYQGVRLKKFEVNTWALEGDLGAVVAVWG